MNQQDENPTKPSKKDRLRPLELVGFSAVLAIFATLVVLLATKDFRLAAIVLGLVFILTLMVVSLVGLGIKPNPEDLEARKSLDDAH
ncbi:MAG TPA: ABC transporter ATP-binding protein [Microbacteriaceae bacterium]|nr:ABC transporter ATP-binding protein [Microbacteriaceae bacterium]